MSDVDETHDPARTSWVESASGSDFPIQNLPLGIFSDRRSEPRGRASRSATTSSTSPAIADLLDEDWRDDLSQPVLNAWLARGPDDAARASRAPVRAAVATSAIATTSSRI